MLLVYFDDRGFRSVPTLDFAVAEAVESCPPKLVRNMVAVGSLPSELSSSLQFTISVDEGSEGNVIEDSWTGFLGVDSTCRNMFVEPVRLSSWCR